VYIPSRKPRDAAAVRGRSAFLTFLRNASESFERTALASSTVPSMFNASKTPSTPSAFALTTLAGRVATPAASTRRETFVSSMSRTNKRMSRDTPDDEPRSFSGSGA
jgi:hypothetical protein